MSTNQSFEGNCPLYGQAYLIEKNKKLKEILNKIGRICTGQDSLEFEVPDIVQIARLVDESEE